MRRKLHLRIVYRHLVNVEIIKIHLMISISIYLKKIFTNNLRSRRPIAGVVETFSTSAAVHPLQPAIDRQLKMVAAKDDDQLQPVGTLFCEPPNCSIEFASSPDHQRIKTNVKIAEIDSHQNI